MLDAACCMQFWYNVIMWGDKIQERTMLCRDNIDDGYDDHVARSPHTQTAC